MSGVYPVMNLLNLAIRQAGRVLRHDWRTIDFVQSNHETRVRRCCTDLCIVPRAKMKKISAAGIDLNQQKWFS